MTEPVRAPLLTGTVAPDVGDEEIGKKGSGDQGWISLDGMEMHGMAWMVARDCSELCCFGSSGTRIRAKLPRPSFGMMP